jgi:hypothetical protein
MMSLATWRAVFVVSGLYFASGLPVLAGACTTQQTADIDKAMGAAGDVAKRALADLPTKATDNKPNFKDYFGAFDASRLAIVKTTLSQVIATMTVAKRNYFCFADTQSFCADGHTAAWVDAKKPYDISICQRFYGLASEQSPLLIHELSHFLVNGGTDSTTAGHHCKTEVDCKALAVSDPGKAVVAGYAYQLYTLKY